MKNKLNYFSAILLVIALSACNQTPANNKIPSNNKTPSGNQITDVSGKPEAAIAPEKDFTEGVIKVSISLPGSPMGKVFAQIDPEKGNMQVQMKSIRDKMSAADQKIFQEESQKLGFAMMGLVLLPPKTTIYMKGDEATAKMEALTYSGENTINSRTKKGMFYVKSRTNKTDISFTYDDKNSYKAFAGTLTDKEYNIVKTKETEVVAGYVCTKSIYTEKNAGKPASAAQAASASGVGAYKVEVWSSDLMPRSINFLHPLYVEEAGGIMKLVIYPKKESDLKVLYEFTSVERRPVTSAEMTVKKTAKVYDYGKDIQTLGWKLFGVMLGATEQSYN
ncbi:hypothetical protein [Pedobacter metabolipauper]|uniref:GLPGLI family protein n=1 Tax=Pedobacter metabolipauper TaxID=425513 RepID=A0A4V3D1P0_9SPHI|nr:hypothetical protein [Pedobacter metabolipauper]TDQ11793.1 hypothetical protein ATK78_0921 [Pedobacter metabolipauper]